MAQVRDSFTDVIIAQNLPTDFIKGRISPLPLLPTNEEHSSRAGLELKDLPEHSAVTMRLGPHTLITWGSVGASLIM